MPNFHSLIMLKIMLIPTVISLIMTLTTTVRAFACECTHVRLCPTFRLFLVGALGYEDGHALPSFGRHCDSQRSKP